MAISWDQTERPRICDITVCNFHLGGEMPPEQAANDTSA